MHTLREAERAGDRLAAVLGVASCTRSSLERVPASELVAATEELGKRSPDPGMLPLPFIPVVDGVLLPDHPLAAVANGAAAGIDLLIGTNRDELTLFGLGNPALMAFDDDGVTRWVGNAAPDMPGAEVIDAYRSARQAREESIEGNAIVNQCLERQLLINCTHGTVLRLLPALNLSDEQLYAGCDIMEEVLLSSVRSP